MQVLSQMASLLSLLTILKITRPKIVQVKTIFQLIMALINARTVVLSTAVYKSARNAVETPSNTDNFESIDNGVNSDNLANRLLKNHIGIMHDVPESDHLKIELDEMKSSYELTSVILKHDALETDNKQTPNIKNTDNNTMLNVRMCQYECVLGVSGTHNNTKLEMIR